MCIFCKFSVDNPNQKRTVIATTNEIINLFKVVKVKMIKSKKQEINYGKKFCSLEWSYINKI